MKRILTFLATLLAALAILPGAQAASGKLVLTGSSTVAPLALEIGKRFEAANPGIRVDVQTGGSSRGVADAMNGLADIGLVSRSLKPVEAKTLVAHTIALDGVALIVNASNPVRQLDDAQIQAIYTGQTRNWRAAGGPDRPITVVSKAEGRSTLELFLHYTGLKNSQIRAQAVIGDNQQGIKTVAGNPGAIGYVSIGAAEYAVEHGIPIRLLPMAGVAATTDAVQRGHFPLSRPLNLVTRGAPSPLAARFIAFAQSPAVRDLIEAQYFVPPPR
ncbi:MAG: phosphate ABC transporter substrate-binding protein [Thiobacillus sp.]|nr:phosphate ABC transporter substrate-binding protein [Thiobacillus sp.]